MSTDRKTIEFMNTILNTAINNSMSKYRPSLDLLKCCSAQKCSSKEQATLMS
jgi:hypothetical protein